jgi:Kdo2-lipid IVA lauroyltransferase/acyltransferase
MKGEFLRCVMRLSRHFQSRLMDISLKFMEGAMRILPRWLIGLLMEGLFPIVCLNTQELNRICKRNLQLVYGDSDDKKKYELIARRCIKSIGYAMMDLLYYVDRPNELSKITHIENEDNLKKALEAGRGAIVVSAHLGNFPLMFVSLMQKGYKVNVIIRSMRDENFSRFMYQLCDKPGIKMIQTSPRKKFLTESLGALERNELLFFLLDEVVAQQKGVKVQFLNREVTRAVGPVLFAERTSSPILPMFIAQDEKKHFKIFIEQPINIHKGGNKQKNIEKIIVSFNSILEHFVYRYPFQWGGWFNKRWALGTEAQRPTAHFPALLPA